MVNAKSMDRICCKIHLSIANENPLDRRYLQNRSINGEHEAFGINLFQNIFVNGECEAYRQKILQNILVKFKCEIYE